MLSDNLGNSLKIALFHDGSRGIVGERKDKDLGLIGYLFLNNEEPRMEYLIYKSFDICDGVITKETET